MARRNRTCLLAFAFVACTSSDDDTAADAGDATSTGGAPSTTSTVSSTSEPSTTEPAPTSTTSTGVDPSESSSDGGSSEEGSTGGGGAHVPDGVLFFDGFDYDVPREAADKFGPDGRFGAHGWSWGKDAVNNGPGAGGWLWTTSEIPGYRGALPGVESSHVLCVESGAGTYAGVIEGAWRQTDFYLQYGDPATGELDTIPPDVWIQHWMYIADSPEQPSLFPPTVRLGKWFYPTRNDYPGTDLEWLFTLTGVVVDSETQLLGSSAELDIGVRSVGTELALTDVEDTVYTDGRPDGATGLGHCGGDPDYLTPLDANRWWLLRVHIDHTVDPGVAQVWAQPQGGEWIKLMDSTTSPVVEWNPVNRVDGHRGLRFPTTMSNWFQAPEEQTTHGDWWIYVDDFAIAAGEHAGGNGADDLPQY